MDGMANCPGSIWLIKPFVNDGANPEAVLTLAGRPDLGCLAVFSASHRSVRTRQILSPQTTNERENRSQTASPLLAA
ncbi:hypothetical protein ACTXT7_012801 [Hymenolepis weldensis]